MSQYNVHMKYFMAIILMIVAVCLFHQAYAGIIQGDPKGQISLTEVFDYQCPHCRAEFPIIQKLEANNPTLKLNLYPVAILNHLSLIQASSSIAVALSSKTGLQFSMLNNAYLKLPFHSKQSIYAFLERMGANATILKPLMHSRDVLSQLQSGEAIMHEVGAKGVPVLILKKANKIIAVHIGETSYQSLQADIHRAQ